LKDSIIDKANQEDLDNLVMAINNNEFGFGSESVISSPAVE